MSRYGKGRGNTSKQRPSTVEEGKAWLRKFCIDMFDQGDGREADWPVIAQTMFAASFSIIDEAQSSERAMKVLRRVEEGLYKRLARNGDSDLSPSLGMGPPSLPDPLRPERAPEPRNRP